MKEMARRLAMGCRFLSLTVLGRRPNISTHIDMGNV